MTVQQLLRVGRNEPPNPLTEGAAWGEAEILVS
jgi:hypothetical protein